MKIASASGSTGSATNVSLRLVVTRMISVPTSKTSACKDNSSP